MFEILEILQHILTLSQILEPTERNLKKNG